MGLDQQLRSWGVSAEQEHSTEAYHRSSSGVVAPELDVEEIERCAVQVLEPAALHAVQRHAEAGRDARWVVGVVGRGTQVLEYTSDAKQYQEAQKL